MALTLAPFADLAALLDLDKPTLGDYPALEWAAGNVRAAFEAFLGRSLEAMERTEEVFLPVDGTAQVPLAALPVRSVADVLVDGEPEDQFSRASYGLRLDAAQAGVPVQVTYTGGYDDTSLPGAIRRAAVYQVAYEYQAHDFVGAESVQMDSGGNVERPELSLLKHVRSQLQPYVHPFKTVPI